MEKRKFSRFFRIIASFVILTFSVMLVGPLPQIYGESVLGLPLPGEMLPLSRTFTPPILRGMVIHPESPLTFDFIVDQGELPIKKEDLKEESQKLIKYFLASLAIPEEHLWVNLSPYEKDRIIPEAFGLTEMGQDLLGQDYILKQTMASLTYPERGLGAEFWDRVYAQAFERYGTTNIPLNTFNKVWIVPDRARVYVKKDTVFVIKSHLKVMMEEDYLALNKNLSNKEVGTESIEDQDVKEISNVSSEIAREILLPEIEREVNEGKNFVSLRQIYNSLILATWHKKNLKESILNHIYSDQKKIAGVEVKDKKIREKIYQQYLKAFREGVYNYIKEDYDSMEQEVIARKYFSGGANFTDMAALTDSTTDSKEMKTILASAGELLKRLQMVKGNYAPEIEDEGEQRRLRRERHKKILEEETDVNSEKYRQWYQGQREQIEKRLGVKTPEEYLALEEFHITTGRPKGPQPAEKIMSLIKQRKRKRFLMELGGGNTATAMAIAKKQKDVNVVTADLYDTHARGEYGQYAMAFENRALSAQTADLPNLAVSRATADFLLRLDDESIDFLLLNAPERVVLQDLIILIRDFNLLDRLKSDGQIFIRASSLLDYYIGLIERLIGDKVEIEKTSNAEIFGVNLNEGSDFASDPSDTFVWTLRKKKIDAKAIGGDQAMMTSGDAIIDATPRYNEIRDPWRLSPELSQRIKEIEGHVQLYKFHLRLSEEDVADVLKVILPILHNLQIPNKVINGLELLREQLDSSRLYANRGLAIYFFESDAERMANQFGLNEVAKRFSRNPYEVSAMFLGMWMERALKAKGVKGPPDDHQWDLEGKDGDKRFGGENSTGLIGYRHGSLGLYDAGDEYIVLPDGQTTDDNRYRHKHPEIELTMSAGHQLFDNLEEVLDRVAKGKEASSNQAHNEEEGISSFQESFTEASKMMRGFRGLIARDEENEVYEREFDITFNCLDDDQLLCPVYVEKYPKNQ